MKRQGSLELAIARHDVVASERKHNSTVGIPIDTKLKIRASDLTDARTDGTIEVNNIKLQMKQQDAGVGEM